MQLLSILLLTQTWYSISMAPNGHSVVLGDYAGSDANPSAMPTLLFVAVALLVVGFTTGVGRIIAIVAALLGSAGALVLTGVATLTRNISALDSSLDRLTGIAQTHGISGLTTTQSAYAWAWLASQLLISLLLVASLWWQRNWVPGQTRAKAGAEADAKLGAGSRKKPAAKKSAIELWDEQRD
jgi:hypothetical protein